MKRIATAPRDNWQAKVEAAGLTYHTPEGRPYWDESAYYELSWKEVDDLEAAANELHLRCIDAAEHVINQNLFTRMGIPERAVPFIKKSWERDDFSLYGRFDLAFDGRAAPKMLEYNADTPTALVEAAVAQWYWLQDTNKYSDQFNSIHEKLIAAWKQYGPRAQGTVHLGGVKESPEDEQTVLYIQDTCHQAGLATRQLFIEDLGFDSQRKLFVDGENQTVGHYFKLYPWEWMWHEEFAFCLELEICGFVEPMWKMLLSNKAILPVLWELFPGHPNLLPAYASADGFKSGEAADGWVQKPKLSREGANVTIVEGGKPTETSGGEYGEEGYVFQALARLPDFEGRRPVMGVWIVNHEACGLGIREETGRITGNGSRFVPHLF
jgi:glutathionylspermidine synthase